jgi:hypothetical protein
MSPSRHGLVSPFPFTANQPHPAIDFYEISHPGPAATRLCFGGHSLIDDPAHRHRGGLADLGGYAEAVVQRVPEYVARWTARR